MKKVTVKPYDKLHRWVCAEGRSDLLLFWGDLETIFGELPRKGETRSYYIVPAGDVAELELEKIQTDGKPWNLSGEQCAVGLSAMEVEGLFGLLHIPDGLTNITAIVHPPDEPTEDTVEAIPAKQPILLKRNNTPTRPGNYVAHWDGETFASVVKDFDTGQLEFTCPPDNRFTVWPDDPADILWSDELGPIEFEAEPEPPPKLRQGYFEHEGQRYRVVDMERGSHPLCVSPALHGCLTFIQEFFDGNGIEINWYGDDA